MPATVNVHHLATLQHASRLQRKTAQKIVFQALREATVTETVVRHFRTLAKLRKSTQADCPAAFFEEFLELQRQISQTMDLLQYLTKFSTTLLIRRNPNLGEEIQLRISTKLTKEIEQGAANWFIRFMEKVMEKGMKKCKGTGDADVNKDPQSLIFQVVNWVEAEQSADSTR
ncbi:hypothetical protein Bca4012_031843 [Brassica carinata]